VGTRGQSRETTACRIFAKSRAIFEFLASDVSADTYVNIMGQYRPEYRAAEYPEINRRPTAEEMATARRVGRDAGLHRFDERSARRLFVVG
jgi:putative pyruvate formate lyase activating enzyme